jgi:hypothetical protein
MFLVLQLFFGWPAIGLFIGLATVAAWLSNQHMMIAAFVFSLGPSFYIVAGNGWIQLAGLYIPLSLGTSIALIKYRKNLIPKLLLVPMYVFYSWFGYVVATQ